MRSGANDTDIISKDEDNGILETDMSDGSIQ